MNNLTQISNKIQNIYGSIPNVVESMLMNTSYFLTFYNFTQKQDWMKEEREKLWDDYNWTISYYFSLKLNESYDSIFPFGKSTNKIIRYASAGIVSLNIVNHLTTIHNQRG